MSDPILAPAHYTVYPVQPIEITRYLGFCLGNAAKYVLRAPYKGGAEDCLKALRYLELEKEKRQDPLTALSYEALECNASELADFFMQASGDQLWLDIAHESSCFLAVLIAYGRCREEFMLMQMRRYVYELKRILSLRDTSGQIYEGMTGFPEEQNGQQI